tara:strand:+ start:283 stop:438 length:156 start_codon:yes stop_codon:yes gene_type:complete
MAKKAKKATVQRRNIHVLTAISRPGGAMANREGDVRKGRSRKVKHKNQRDW